MIKSITRGNGSIGSPDTVTEVSGFGLDFQTLEKDLREAFGLLGQEEGGGLVLRAGRDVLLSLGLRIVPEASRGLVAESYYRGALCFVREPFSPGIADWWTVSRDAQASVEATQQLQAQDDMTRPHQTLGELTKDSGVRQKLDEAAAAKEKETLAAAARTENIEKSWSSSLTDLTNAFDAQSVDPRSGPAAMLRADLRLLITSAREQNAREGVKCRELSVAITNLETAYLWIGEMSAGEGHSLDFNK